jgi:hypothetical protein
MNPTHVQLMLNHIPVLGAVFGLALLTFALWRKSEELRKAALGTFLVAALVAVPAYLTGEPAEDSVESLPGASASAINMPTGPAPTTKTSVCCGRIKSRSSGCSYQSRAAMNWLMKSWRTFTFGWRLLVTNSWKPNLKRRRGATMGTLMHQSAVSPSSVAYGCTFIGSCHGRTCSSAALVATTKVNNHAAKSVRFSAT